MTYYDWSRWLTTVCRMTRFAIAVTALVFLVAAAAPADVAPALTADGFYIEAGSDADPSAVSDAVAAARFAGGALSAAVLSTEPSGGATVFAENTLDAMGGRGTVFVVGPESVGWASQDDIYTRDQLDAATDSSLDGGSDTEVVELFVVSLTGQSIGADTSPGGGFPWGWLFLLAVVGGGAFLFWRSSQASRERVDATIEAARAEVKNRLDDVANDIIDLEDEVALSDDSTVREHYEAATSAYAAALKGYEDASSPEALMEMASELDIAIWRLDCADAILDGEPLPPKPEKPAPEPPGQVVRSETQPPPVSRDTSPFPVPSPRQTQPEYRRPQRRRSSGTSSMMQAMLVGSMMSSSKRRRSGARARPKPASARRMRGGGRRRG